MRGLSRTWWRRAKKANQHEPVSMRFYNVWETVSRFAAENRTSDFMAEMTRRRDAHGSEGIMGLLDCATLRVDALATTGGSRRVGWICRDVFCLYLESVCR